MLFRISEVFERMGEMLWFLGCDACLLLSLEAERRAGELYAGTVMAQDYLCVCLIICVSTRFWASSDSIFARFVTRGMGYILCVLWVFVGFTLLSCVCIVVFSKLVDLELMSSTGTMTRVS